MRYYISEIYFHVNATQKSAVLIPINLAECKIMKSRNQFIYNYLMQNPANKTNGLPAENI